MAQSLKAKKNPDLNLKIQFVPRSKQTHLYFIFLFQYFISIKKLKNKNKKHLSVF